MIEHIGQTDTNTDPFELLDDETDLDAFESDLFEWLRADDDDSIEDEEYTTPCCGGPLAHCHCNDEWDD